MLSTQEFNGREYHTFCQQQYDTARRFLKNCGKPQDEVEQFLVDKHRKDAQIFGAALDRTKVIECAGGAQLPAHVAAILYRLAELEKEKAELTAAIISLRKKETEVRNKVGVGPVSDHI